MTLPPSPIRLLETYSPFADGSSDVLAARYAIERLNEILPSVKISVGTEYLSAHFTAEQSSFLDEPIYDLKPIPGINRLVSMGRARFLDAVANMLLAAGWCRVDFNPLSLFAAWNGLEVTTIDGVRFFAPHVARCAIALDAPVRPSFADGAWRPMPDGTKEWIPKQRIHSVRYLLGADTLEG